MSFNLEELLPQKFLLLFYLYFLLQQPHMYGKRAHQMGILNVYVIFSFLIGLLSPMPSLTFPFNQIFSYTLVISCRTLFFQVIWFVCGCKNKYTTCRLKLYQVCHRHFFLQFPSQELKRWKTYQPQSLANLARTLAAHI